ncbi:MAG: hypothetical protein IIB08_05325 [Bacteroidetes bacterium]|nr:hypothetical protein [Bacteroidota bacterium]
MEKPSDHIVKYLIIFVIGVILIKTTSGSGIFVSKIHKGKGYSVQIPKGWKKVKENKGIIYPKDVELVTFVPKSIDLKIQEPDVFISIFTKKLSTPIWIEDEFPDILQSLREAGFDVKDKGEIKLDNVISKWVVYHEKKIPALVLEFYMVTDASIFYKMQYSAHPDKFNVARADFEELKNSFKFRFSLF